MTNKIAAASVCLSFLLGASAWSAPVKLHPPLKTSPFSVDEIRVATDDGGHGGGYGGASESWTLRASNIAFHSKTFSAADTVGSGAVDVNDVGVMPSGSFQRMLDYLQWTRLLDLKLPKPDPNAQESGYTVTLVRDGKTKSLRISGATLPALASVSTTSALIDSLTKNVVWKTAAQFKTGTGLAVLYQIDDTLSKADTEAAQTFPLPILSVLSAMGKEVAVLRPNTDKERTAFLSPPPVYSYPASYTRSEDVSSFFTLAPGTYRLSFKKLETPAPITATRFAWRPVTEAMDNQADNPAKASVTVKLGEFNFVVIRLEKNPTPKAAKG